MDPHGGIYDFGTHPLGGEKKATRLLPKPVSDRIKETKGALPITANTLANYRSFQL